MIEDLNDLELVNEVKLENSGEALVELTARHSGIFIDMVQKYGSKMTATQKQDIIDSKELYIHKSAQKYNPEKSKFSTFLAHAAKYLCLTQTAANTKTTVINYDDVEFMEADPGPKPDEACMEHEILEKVLGILNEHPDERIRTIFQERYFNGEGSKLTPWKKIAALVGVSIQGCIYLHDQTIQNLQRRINYA